MVERAVSPVPGQRLDHRIDDLAASRSALVDQALGGGQRATMHDLPVFGMFDLLLFSQLPLLHVHDQYGGCRRLERLVALETKWVEGNGHGCFLAGISVC